MKKEIKDKDYFFIAGAFGIVVLVVFIIGIIFGAGFEIGDPIAKGKYTTIRQIIPYKHCISVIDCQRNEPLFQFVIDKLRVDKLSTQCAK